MEAENSKGKNANESDCIEIELLVLGKKAGLSFDEMNMLQVSELFKFLSIHTGAEKKKPRKATQADIDKFFA